MVTSRLGLVTHLGVFALWSAKALLCVDTIQTITLIGAVVAAATGIVGSALALLTYKRSGKRDELAWRRSSLVLALTTFLDSSFKILSDEALKAHHYKRAVLTQP